MNINKKLLRSYYNIISEAPQYDMDSYDTVSKAQGTGAKKWRLGLIDYMLNNNMQGYFWKEVPSVINEGLSQEAVESILGTYCSDCAEAVQEVAGSNLTYTYAFVGANISLNANTHTMNLSPIMAIYSNDGSAPSTVTAGKAFFLANINKKIVGSSFLSVFEIPDSQTITYRNVSNDYIKTHDTPIAHFNYIMNAAWKTLREASGLTQDELETMGRDVFAKMGQQPEEYC